MPTLECNDQEFQVLVNALAMTHPLVRKFMDQYQEQQNANGNTERSAAPEGQRVGPPTRRGGNSQHYGEADPNSERDTFNALSGRTRD